MSQERSRDHSCLVARGGSDAWCMGVLAVHITRTNASKSHVIKVLSSPEEEEQEQEEEEQQQPQQQRRALFESAFAMPTRLKRLLECLLFRALPWTATLLRSLKPSARTSNLIDSFALLLSQQRSKWFARYSCEAVLSSGSDVTRFFILSFQRSTWYACMEV